MAVNRYRAQEELQPPEQAIFREHSAELASAAMLDVGVGAGRTTACLARRARSYFATDFSPAMAAAFRSRFPDLESNVAVLDARSMPSLSDNSFDITLFSFNGLDYLPSWPDRLAALREIHRVTKPGGLFVFSSHNLAWPGLRSFWPSGRKPLLEKAEHAVKQLYRVIANPSYAETLAMPWARVRDGGHLFTLCNTYVRPSEQRAQVEQEAFADVAMYALEDGRKYRRPMTFPILGLLHLSRGQRST